MLNVFAAAAKLTTLQISRGARKWGTLMAFMVPVAYAALARAFPQHIKLEGYAGFVTAVYTSLLVPFIGVFWGTTLLADDIQAKTLVYLWTRPTSRVGLFLAKFLVMGIWLVVLLSISLAAVFTITYYKDGFAEVRENAMMLVWDIRALALGGLTYAALAYLLATIFKKPLIIGLIYVFTADEFAWFLPGYLKRFSIRHHVYVLSSHPDQGKPTGTLEFLTQHDTTELQAWVTLLVATTVLLLLASLVLRNREFLAEDTARATA